jgi:hypothetical protein
MESGWEPLLRDLEVIWRRGRKIKVLANGIMKFPDGKVAGAADAFACVMRHGMMGEEALLLGATCRAANRAHKMAFLGYKACPPNNKMMKVSNLSSFSYYAPSSFFRRRWAKILAGEFP